MSVLPRTFETSECSVAWMLGAQSLPTHVDPDRPALRWRDTVRSYAELRSRALSLARSLRDMGLERGDRVLVHVLNRHEPYELYFACAYAGLTLVPTNWRLGTREIALIIEDCAPRVVVTQRELESLTREACSGQELELVTLEDYESGERYEAMATGPAIEPPYERCEPHLILYTSGTTGRPKGVMVSHMNAMWLALQQAANYPGWGTDMVLLLYAAIGNTAGMNEQTIPTFMAGGTLGIAESRDWTPEKMARVVDDWGVTHSVMFPSMMEPFLHADAQSKIGFGTLRFLLTGGENTPPATLARFRRRWSHISVSLAYGSTESGLPTMIFDDEIDRHPGSVGRVAMGHAVRIQSRDGQVLAVGEVGEIWVASPAAVSGYWNAPEVNAEVVRDGWLNTGDLGRFDEDGYLYLQGRSRDLIISKGQNIYPAEIENVLSEFEDLLEFTVVGMPDEEFGEAVCAVVIAKPDRDVTADDVIEFVRSRLASYKKPRHVVFVDELPRNAGNKVLKHQVVEQVSRELALG